MATANSRSKISASHPLINIVVLESGVVHDGVIPTEDIKAKARRGAVVVGQYSSEQPCSITWPTTKLKDLWNCLVYLWCCHLTRGHIFYSINHYHMPCNRIPYINPPRSWLACHTISIVLLVRRVFLSSKSMRPWNSPLKPIWANILAWGKMGRSHCHALMFKDITSSHSATME